MEYFNLSEFGCSCCGKVVMSTKFTNKIDKARKLSGVPFQITSGYRCEAHNEAIGGVEGSSHTRGFAADVAAPSSPVRYDIVRGALAAGFNRIGIYETFIHLDCDPDKPEDVIWHG